jgi:hypothetical protein
MPRTSAVNYVSRLGLAGSSGRVWRFCIGHTEGYLEVYRRKGCDGLLWCSREKIRMVW